MAPTFVLKFTRAPSGALNLVSEYEGPLITICGEWRDNVTYSEVVDGADAISFLVAPSSCVRI